MIRAGDEIRATVHMCDGGKQRHRIRLDRPIGWPEIIERLEEVTGISEYYFVGLKVDVYRDGVVLR